MRVSKLDKLQDKLLHSAGKAIADYNMIQRGDRVMVCLSGGKDSFTRLHLLHELRRKSRSKFEVFSYTLDQRQPGWDDTRLRAWLEERGYPFVFVFFVFFLVVVVLFLVGLFFCLLCLCLCCGS